PNGNDLVSASGTPVLAAAGSGDLLSGIAGTILTQTGDALVSGAVAAWVHGRAAELATPAHSRPTLNAQRSTHDAPHIRAVTLEDVLAALPLGWPRSSPIPRFP